MLNFTICKNFQLWLDHVPLLIIGLQNRVQRWGEFARLHNPLPSKAK